MSAELIIKVRYTDQTYLAKASGAKLSASCTISAIESARALVRKLGADPDTLAHSESQSGMDVFHCTAAART